MKYITNEPAILVGKTLIIADLHIGIEHEFRKAGIKVGSQTSRMAERLEKLLKSTRAERLIILGDIKHKVPGISWQEIKELPEFLQHFKKQVDIELVLGNHDSNIKDILKGVKIHPSSGFLLKTGPYAIDLVHGHAYPTEDIFKAKQVISAHVHPEFVFKNRMGYRWKEQIWLKAKLNAKKLAEKIGVKTSKNRIDLTIMPAFNPLVGGGTNWQKNRKLSPLMNYVDFKTAEIYLLDGTFLGKFGKIKSV